MVLCLEQYQSWYCVCMFGSSEANIIPSLASCIEIYFFSSSWFCKHRGHGKFIRGVQIIGKAVPESHLCTNRMKFMNTFIEYAVVATSKYQHHTQTQHRVIIPFLNSSTDEWSICGPLIDKSSLTLKFSAALIHSSYSEEHYSPTDDSIQFCIFEYAGRDWLRAKF